MSFKELSLKRFYARNPEGGEDFGAFPFKRNTITPVTEGQHEGVPTPTDSDVPPPEHQPQDDTSEMNELYSGSHSTDAYHHEGKTYYSGDQAMPPEATYLGWATRRNIHGPDGKIEGHEVTTRLASHPEIDRTIDRFDTDGNHVSRSTEKLSPEDAQIVAGNLADRAREQVQDQENLWNNLTPDQQFDYLKNMYGNHQFFKPGGEYSSDKRSIAQRHWDAGEVTSLTLNRWKESLEHTAKHQPEIRTNRST